MVEFIYNFTLDHFWPLYISGVVVVFSFCLVFNYFLRKEATPEQLFPVTEEYIQLSTAIVSSLFSWFSVLGFILTLVIGGLFLEISQFKIYRKINRKFKFIKKENNGN